MRGPGSGGYAAASPRAWEARSPARGGGMLRDAPRDADGFPVDTARDDWRGNGPRYSPSRHEHHGGAASPTARDAARTAIPDEPPRGSYPAASSSSPGAVTMLAEENRQLRQQRESLLDRCAELEAELALRRSPPRHAPPAPSPTRAAHMHSTGVNGVHASPQQQRDGGISGAATDAASPPVSAVRPQSFSPRPQAVAQDDQYDVIAALSQQRAGDNEVLSRRVHELEELVISAKATESALREKLAAAEREATDARRVAADLKIAASAAQREREVQAQFDTPRRAPSAAPSAPPKADATPQHEPRGSTATPSQPRAADLLGSWNPGGDAGQPQPPAATRWKSPARARDSATVAAPPAPTAQAPKTKLPLKAPGSLRHADAASQGAAPPAPVTPQAALKLRVAPPPSRSPDASDSPPQGGAVTPPRASPRGPSPPVAVKKTAPLPQPGKKLPLIAARSPSTQETAVGAGPSLKSSLPTPGKALPKAPSPPASSPPANDASPTPDVLTRAAPPVPPLPPTPLFASGKVIAAVALAAMLAGFALAQLGGSAPPPPPPPPPAPLPPAPVQWAWTALLGHVLNTVWGWLFADWS